VTSIHDFYCILENTNHTAGRVTLSYTLSSSLNNTTKSLIKIEHRTHSITNQTTSVMSRFSNLVSGLRGADERDRILQVLNASPISGEEALRDIVQGRNIEQVTSLLERNLELNELDASALAGVLCQPGKLIDFILILSIKHFLCKIPIDGCSFNICCCLSI
jgi:hypothetical protein